jgi:hypothetical protein
MTTLTADAAVLQPAAYQPTVLEPPRREPADPELVASEPVPELQADPSHRFQAEPEPLPSPAYEPAAAPLPRKGWREQRAERRRRRVWLEEVLAWILVPVIVIGAWWFVDTVLTALGTSPSAIVNGLSAITSAL